MNRQPDFSKNAAYLSLMERKNFMKLKKTIVLLSYQVMKPFAVPRACKR